MENLNYDGMVFYVFDSVYSPSEDSFLLAEETKKLEGSILEIGCGTGFCSIIASKHCKGKVLGVDTNREAVENSIYNAQLNHSNALFKNSDMFSNISEKFDYVIFNPPYLGKPNKGEKLSNKKAELPFLDDGQISIFLEYVKKYARKGFLLILSDANENYKIYLKKAKSLGAKEISYKKFFFEKIVLLRADF